MNDHVKRTLYYDWRVCRCPRIPFGNSGCKDYLLISKNDLLWALLDQMVEK